MLIAGFALLLTPTSVEAASNRTESSLVHHKQPVATLTMVVCIGIFGFGEACA